MAGLGGSPAPRPPRRPAPTRRCSSPTRSPRPHRDSSASASARARESSSSASSRARRTTASASASRDSDSFSASTRSRSASCSAASRSASASAVALRAVRGRRERPGRAPPRRACERRHPAARPRPGRSRAAPPPWSRRAAGWLRPLARRWPARGRRRCGRWRPRSAPPRAAGHARPRPTAAAGWPARSRRRRSPAPHRRRRRGAGPRRPGRGRPLPGPPRGAAAPPRGAAGPRRSPRSASSSASRRSCSAMSCARCRSTAAAPSGLCAPLWARSSRAGCSVSMLRILSGVRPLTKPESLGYLPVLLDDDLDPLELLELGVAGRGHRSRAGHRSGSSCRRRLARDRTGSPRGCRPARTARAAPRGSSGWWASAPQWKPRPGASVARANGEPTITASAPQAIALAMSPDLPIEPSAITCT